MVLHSQAGDEKLNGFGSGSIDLYTLSHMELRLDVVLHSKAEDEKWIDLYILSHMATENIYIYDLIRQKLASSV